MDLNAGYYQDITDVHNGYEVTLGLSKRFLLTDNWSLYLGANANHKSKKLLKYYYGITPEEGLLPAFTYQPNSSGNNYSFIVNSEYAFHDNWSWQLLIKRNLLSDEITDSLIVNTKHTDTYFFGIKYTL
ncbi:MipA/OmpV family protein [Kangiella sediminilitoris]|uniref:MltA-interacting MipA family protein n=1 Tax=Kangiella sediminilitoris TaxID=1144748 RepID=A0A1B3BC90_9GAMM|nr:MipA/OmpV family protein [Kangiella sediminilitoris]AOE50429.1 hypothetical protein KS2013_1720 [Kangiella sediminilitoris]